MKPNELRIGNIVLCNEVEIKITGVVRNDRNARIYDEQNNDWSICRIKPIPLTEELLLKLGFERIDSGHAEEHEDYHEWHEKTYPTLGCVYQGDEDYVFCEKFDDRKIYFLHEFQNFHHAITGEELNVEM